MKTEMKLKEISGLQFSRSRKFRGVVREEMPYGCQRVDKGVAFFNRSYETILLISRDEHPLHAKFRKLKDLPEFDGKSRGEMIWFYNDASMPWVNKANLRRYQEKIEILAQEIN